MAKKKTLTMWALWNFDVLQDVSYTRRACREAATRLCSRGKPMADEMFKSGAFRIGKVAVRALS